MSIIQRFKTIMASNVHAYLDKAEDPEAMINQYLRTINLDLGRVKSETAAFETQEKRAKRALDECNAEINKMQRYAQKSVESGNEGNARNFLEKKAELVKKQSKLQEAFDLAASNSIHLKQMHDKLIGDIKELEARASTIKGKAVMAKNQEKLNKMRTSFSGFGNLEEKVDLRLEEAKALANLRKDPFDDFEHPTAKPEKEVDIDDELAYLKNQIRQKE